MAQLYTQRQSVRKVEIKRERGRRRNKKLLSTEVWAGVERSQEGGQCRGNTGDWGQVRFGAVRYTNSLIRELTRAVTACVSESGGFEKLMAIKKY